MCKKRKKSKCWKNQSITPITQTVKLTPVAMFCNKMK